MTRYSLEDPEIRMHRTFLDDICHSALAGDPEKYVKAAGKQDDRLLKSVILGRWNDWPIEWWVLDERSGNHACKDSILLLSRYALYLCPFNEIEAATDNPFRGKNLPTTWKNSDIRYVLNSDFLTDCFNETERSLIFSENIITRDNPKYFTNGCQDVYDKVFLFSAEEALYYLRNDMVRKTDSIFRDYHPRPDPLPSDKKPEWIPFCWLRSPGEKDGYMTYINSVEPTDSVSKELNLEGADATTRGLIRPAMWVDRSVLTRI